MYPAPKLVWEFDLRFRRFYKESCVLLLSFVLGFFNEEYLIALVDLIAPCGGTKGQGKRTLREPFLPILWTLTL